MQKGSKARRGCLGSAGHQAAHAFQARPHSRVSNGGSNRFAQRLRRHPGQLLAKAGLAGEGDQHALPLPRPGLGTGARRRLRPAFAPDDQGDQDEPERDGPGGPSGTLALAVTNTPIPCTLEGMTSQKFIQFTVLNIRKKGWIYAPW